MQRVVALGVQMRTEICTFCRRVPVETTLATLHFARGCSVELPWRSCLPSGIAAPVSSAHVSPEAEISLNILVAAPAMLKIPPLHNANALTDDANRRAPSR
jgi:hypothetical protein